MNKITENCIKELKNISSSLVEIEDNNETTEGYNIAVLCIKDGISTRIDLLSDMLDDTENDKTNAIQCIDFIENLIAIINECADEMNGKTKEGYNKAISIFCDNVQPLIDWLETQIE
ncbi:MAG: hypothetical protein IJY01_08075 [Clostridia bacterium]|nr:hypothetical protein [Clostridia bacterium]MBQ8290807.1 hypothetical protein [Clostridia bacterium]